ncbi:hypothetical protein MuYL_4152 [Mucilaginibacter xinganensis]|uniref:Uncharacterized protein n=1 Tax=Mucilaginibacter xinganensis TaxID=1234841 RepID=A0A223P1R6_9SPHI|nr:hypothetical protein MuYL_4152 [Mucilaginibacter xinganensis]
MISVVPCSIFLKLKPFTFYLYDKLFKEINLILSKTCYLSPFIF